MPLIDDRIETPEQVALELPIAGIGSRFLAITIDTLVQGFVALWILLALGIGGAIGGWFPTLGGAWSVLGALAILFAFALYWGYFTTFEIVWSGQTPGKRAAGIRVIRESGRPIDASSAMIRNLLRVIDLLPAMYGAGIVCMLLNRQSQRIGDLVAGTIVVHDQAKLRPFEWDRAARLPPTPEAARLSPEEVLLIETYLARRFELPSDVNQATADQILKRVKARTGLGPAAGEWPPDFLQRIAQQARDASRFR